MDFRNETIMRTRDSSANVDMGLRTFMLRVYNYMTLGLGLTGITAYFVSNSPALMNVLFQSPTVWLVMLAPLGFVMLLSFGINKMSAATAQIVFWVYAAVMGVSLSTIFITYTSTSITKVFFITAGTFGAMSLWGYTTKRDLTGMGSFLFMGLIGIVLASIVNIFVASSALSFGISILGVLIFTGLTAYDTQNIKETYYSHLGEGEAGHKSAIMGALRLYLDFINLFIMLLRLIGDRR